MAYARYGLADCPAWYGRCESVAKEGRAEGLSGLEVHFARSRRQSAASAAMAS
jgi:hypothetical protein